MKKFIAIYHAAPEAMAQAAEATPEQKDAAMQLWFDWKDKIGNALVDFGAPLVGGIAISTAGEKTNSAKQVSGYSIVQATNNEAAHALFEGHPHLSWHATSTIEVHEFLAM